MPDLHVVILAGGKGTRMKSGLPKALHRVAGLPMVVHVLRAAAPLRAASTIVVVGHMAPAVRAALAGDASLQFAVQEPQLGTAHALLQTAPLLAGATGTLLLLSGDAPLLRTRTLERLLHVHTRSAAALTLLTAIVDRPDEYGRVVRENGRLVSVVEERDASPAERQLAEVNSGIYAFDLSLLFEALGAVGAENTQGEYYLPDLVRIYRRRNLPLETLVLKGADEIRGINSRSDLAEASRTVRQSKNEQLMAAGVTIEDPTVTYIEPDVTVGPDTVIHPGVILAGRTRIGSACEIHAGVRIVDAVLEDRVTVHNFCVIVGAHVAEGASIGPFAHLRPGSAIRQDARVGNFVELKKTVLGARSKANHLTYLGDATVGEDVNVGAGTITCNYDGAQKHPTTIEDGAFIGSGAELIAPVRVGHGAYVAAGSSITDDVPPGALAIARARQVNKTGWTRKKKRPGR